MSVGQEYEVTDTPPTAEEFLRLYESVGWRGLATRTTAALAIAGSLYHAVARVEGEVVGMGRVLGDGGMFFYIQDVAVLPTRQGQGIGREIIARLLKRIEVAAPRPCYVLLFAAEGKEGFYQRFDFRPFPGGMIRAYAIDW